MGQHAISGLAVIVVVTFLALALAACSTSAQHADRAPTAVAAIPAEQAGTGEFHGAHIARDALRDRLPSES